MYERRERERREFLPSGGCHRHRRKAPAAHPNLFRVMYDEEMWARISATAPTSAPPSASVAPRGNGFKQPQVLERVRERRDEAFGMFVAAVAEGIRAGTLRSDGSLMLMARSVAALAHGLAMEALDERLPEGEVRPILQIAVEGLRSK